MSTTRSDVLDPKGSDQATGYVLPKPSRSGAELVIDGKSIAPPASLQRHREAEVARSIGHRVGALVECQQQFLDELRTCLREVEDSVGEAARVRLQGQVRSALSVLEWCDAVQEDLKCESAWAERGLQPIALVDFCAEVAARWRPDRSDVQVVGESAQPWWGHAGLLAETVEAGLALVDDRSRGEGSIAIEVDVQRDAANLRITAGGEPTDQVDPALVRVFRQNVERLGARVMPEALGPGGAGLVLALPRAAD